MIARIWHGRTSAARADAYLEFLLQRAEPDYARIPGNRGVQILRRLQGNEAHFLALTHWDSPGAIEAFAGSDISRARYYPEDREFLLEFEPTVAHYELHLRAGG